MLSCAQQVGWCYCNVIWLTTTDEWLSTRQRCCRRSVANRRGKSRTGSVPASAMSCSTWRTTKKQAAKTRIFLVQEYNFEKFQTHFIECFLAIIMYNIHDRMQNIIWFVIEFIFFFRVNVDGIQYFRSSCMAAPIGQNHQKNVLHGGGTPSATRTSKLFYWKLKSAIIQKHATKILTNIPGL